MDDGLQVFNASAEAAGRWGLCTRKKRECGHASWVVFLRYPWDRWGEGFMGKKVRNGISFSIRESGARLELGSSGSALVDQGI